MHHADGLPRSVKSAHMAAKGYLLGPGPLAYAGSPMVVVSVGG